MAGQGTRRKLAAIMAADVVGYSRLMSADEAATVETLKHYRAVIQRIAERRGGRVVNAPGDSILAEFPSAVEAVQAAVEIQKDLESRNTTLAPERAMRFRIGVNVGDIIEEADATIYGDGVNIAARLEALAHAGGICVSSSVFEAVEGKLSLAFDFLGEQQVKNIAKPVRAYRVRVDERPNITSSAGTLPRKRRWPAVAVLVLVGIGIAIAVWRLGSKQRLSSEDPILAMPKGASVAVLPFTNLSGDPSQDYFSDGLSEQLITALARYRALYVIARNSTFQYKGKAVDVRKAGRELGARYVLEGSVQRSDRNLRVTAQLIDANGGAHLWAETYDRTLAGADIFALQDDIVAKTVANIAGPMGEIARAGMGEAKGKPPEGIDSYDCVLRAAAYLKALSPQGHGPVRDCLEKAVARDPNYAEAWAWLAWVYVLEYELGFNPRQNLYDARDRAIETALRAADLDPNSAVVQRHLFWIRFFRHETEPAVAGAERALALNPNDPDVLCLAGHVYAWAAGNWTHGIALIKKSISLTPHYPRWCHFPIVLNHYLRSEYEQSLAETLKVEMPDFYWTHAFLAASYGQLGRADEAKASITRLLKLNPGFSANVRREFRKYNWTADQVERIVEGLRKAGLEVSKE